MNDLEKERLDRRGRKLTGLSMAIFLFILGGGEIGSSVTIFNSSIELQYPNILIISIVAVLLYYYHSFRIANSKAVEEIREIIDSKISQDQKIKSELNETVKKNFENIRQNNPNLGNIRFSTIQIALPQGTEKKFSVSGKNVNIHYRLISSGQSYYLPPTKFNYNLYLRKAWYYFLKDFIWSETFIQKLLPIICFYLTFSSLLTVLLLNYLTKVEWLWPLITTLSVCLIPIYFFRSPRKFNLISQS